jgi:hypothetical protein
MMFILRGPPFLHDDLLLGTSLIPICTHVYAEKNAWPLCLFLNLIPLLLLFHCALIMHHANGINWHSLASIVARHGSP